MPPYPPAPNCLRVTHQHTIGSDTNTGWHLFYRADKAASQAQMDALTAAASASWNTNLAPAHAVDVTLTHVIGSDLSDPGGPVSTNTATHVGTRTGGFLPASTSVLINMTIGRRYRGGKPRIYMPAGTQPDLGSAQTWVAGLLTAVNAGFNAHNVAIQNSIKTWSSTADLVNISYWHQVLASIPPNPPIYVSQLRDTPVIDVIRSYTASSTISSQRRRLRPG